MLSRKDFGTALASIMLLLAILACGLPGTPTPTPTPVVVTPSVITTTPTNPVATNTPTPSSLPVVSSPQLLSFHMLDANNGWALTKDLVLRTRDGGTNWVNTTPAGIASGSLQAASTFYLNTSSAWLLVPSVVVGNPDSLYHTADGGVTWTSASVSFGMASMQFLDNSNGVALISQGSAAGSEAVKIDTTTDSGNTWTQAFINDPTVAGSSNTLPLGGQKSGMTFLDASHGWVSGSEPVSDFIYVYASTDGGHTWAHQNVSLPSGYSGAETGADAPAFFGATDGVLHVGVFANTPATVFYLSHDGGSTWTPTTPTMNSHSFSVASLSDFFVWDGGTTMQVSHDFGATWTAVTPNINVPDTLVTFQFVDATTGWALTGDAASHYTFYKTTDGGTTWATLIP